MPTRTVDCRVRTRGPKKRLELDAGKLARPVLRGPGGSNAIRLPDQALETKARFIAQVMRGNCGARSAEDIGGQELSYAEVKAIASGNPAVLTLAEADAEMQRLAILRRNHADEQYMARRNVRDLPETIGRLEGRIAALAADAATAEEGPSDTPEAVAKRLDRLPFEVKESREYPLGTYRGLELGFVLYPSGSGDVTLSGRTRRNTHVGSQGVRTVLNAAQRIVSSYGPHKEEAERDLEVARGRLADYEARLGRTFAHERYMSELTDLRDRLKLALSDHPPEGEIPSAELSEKIKELRASVTVEEAPKREAKTATGEVPVTRRIRKKPQHVEEPAPPEPPRPPPAITPILLPEPPAFRQVVARRRQEEGRQMTMW